MVKVFEFAERDILELRISGVEFKIDVMDNNFLSKMAEFSGVAESIQKRGVSMSGSSDIGVEIEKIMRECADGLDSLLGEGSVKKIFNGRTIRFIEIAQLSEFVITEINNFTQKDLFEKYNPQRLRE